MNTEAVNQEYQTVNLSQLTESLTNPRKTFDHKALNEMAESIRAGRPPSTVTGSDGLGAVEICEAEEESIRTGKIVKL